MIFVSWMTTTLGFSTEMLNFKQSILFFRELALAENTTNLFLSCFLSSSGPFSSSLLSSVLHFDGIDEKVGLESISFDWDGRELVSFVDCMGLY